MDKRRWKTWREVDSIINVMSSTHDWRHKTEENIWLNTDFSIAQFVGIAQQTNRTCIIMSNCITM